MNTADSEGDNDEIETIEVTTSRTVRLASGDGKAIKEGVVLESDIPDQETGINIRGVVVWIGRMPGDKLSMGTFLADRQGTVVIELSTDPDYRVKGAPRHVIISDFSKYWQVAQRDKTHSEALREFQLLNPVRADSAAVVAVSDVVAVSCLRSMIPEWYWDHLGGVPSTVNLALRATAGYMDRIAKSSRAEVLPREEVLSSTVTDTTGDDRRLSRILAEIETYVVRVRREEHRTHDFTVKAASREAAEAMAIMEADDHDFLQDSACHSEVEVVDAECQTDQPPQGL